MSRRASLQNTYNKGEFDPDLSERTDLEHYYASAALARNCVFHPQGGFSDRGGFEKIDALRTRIVPLVITEAMITAANGGVKARLVDQDATTEFTTNANRANPFVLFEIDLGTAQEVTFVDLEGYKAQTAGVDEAVNVQFWNGAAWIDFNAAAGQPSARHLRTTARTRRFGRSPDAAAVSARQWRAIVTGGDEVTGTITVGGVRMWRATGQLSAIDVIEAAREDDLTYQLVITAHNVDIFRNNAYAASAPLPVASQQVRELDHAGGYDTLIFFHELLAPPRLTRQAADGEWNVDATPFTNVPDLAANLVFSGDEDARHDIGLTGVEAGDEVVVFVGGLATAPIVYSPVTFAANVADALGALPGITENTVDDTHVAVAWADEVLSVTMQGDNGARAWPLISAEFSNRTDLSPLTSVVRSGMDASGKLFSAETGWPRCGLFMQQRLLLAGFLGAPISFAFSTTPARYDFQVTADPLTADLAFVRSIDTDSVQPITSLIVGRHLQMFTSESEWYAEARLIDATQPINMVRTTGNGIRRAVPLVFSDGSTIFVQEGGKTLRDMLWSDPEQSYTAEPLSVLGPQLLEDVIDVAHRSARSVTDGNQIFMVNDASGMIAMLTLLRSQDVIASARWETFGRFRAVMSDIEHDVYVVTERSGRHWLEVWRPDTPLDWAVHLTGTLRTDVPCAHLAGRSDVWVIADGELSGPHTVTGGQITLDVAANDIWAGLAPAFLLRGQAVRGKLPDGSHFRGKGRIYEIEFSVRDTGSLTVGTNGKPHQVVPLLRTGPSFEDGGPLQTEDGGAPGLPMMQRLYTGDVRRQGLTGFSRHPYYEISREVPAPVHVKATRYEIVTGTGGE